MFSTGPSCDANTDEQYVNFKVGNSDSSSGEIFSGKSENEAVVGDMGSHDIAIYRLYTVRKIQLIVLKVLTQNKMRLWS